MREILFRGKTKGGVWVEGYYEKKPNGKTYILNRCTDAPDGDPMWRKVLIEHEVIEETVCQYTGLTDKNGKKIFEGDIISTPKYGVDNGNWKNCAGKDRFLVRYADGTYYLENKLRRFCLRPDSTCGIIGNIFDNPDLITSEKGAGA